MFSQETGAMKWHCCCYFFIDFLHHVSAGMLKAWAGELVSSRTRSLHDRQGTPSHPVPCAHKGSFVDLDWTSVSFSFLCPSLVGQTSIGKEQWPSYLESELENENHCFPLWKLSSKISLETVAPDNSLITYCSISSNGLFNLFPLDFEFRTVF